jgi:hypothetical protein
MALDTMLPGAKPSFSKKGMGAHLLTGGMLPPVTSRTSSDALGITKPKVSVIPGTPTIDDARMQRQATDGIRRRRGVIANIFGGGQASAPAIGTRALMGG